MKRVGYMVLSRFVLTLSVCVLAWRSGGAEFQDGDTVVFLGDSITHGGFYHKFVVDFYRTRYPERKIRFVNSGIGGDTSGRAIKRIPVDIAEYDPTWVVIHFGMNDVGHESYRGDADGRKLRSRAEAYERYVRNMDELVQKIAKAAPRARFIYMTPTPYDEDAVSPPSVKSPGCNVALSMFAGKVLAKAAQDKALGVDLYSPMLNCAKKYRCKNPGFSLIRKDRVHPDVLGHSVMAFEFLKAQGVDSVVSDVKIDAKSLAVLRSGKAKVSGMSTVKDGVSFSVLEESLPCPVDPSAATLLEGLGFHESLNRQMLSVVNLLPGRYSVSIDGNPIGQWSAKDLAIGVNIAKIESTAQNGQARKVFDANERNRSAERIIRNHHCVRWYYAGMVDVDDVNAVAKYFSDRGGKRFFAGYVPGYVKYWPRYRTVRAELLSSQEKVYALAVPKTHRYEVMRIKKEAY